MSAKWKEPPPVAGEQANQPEEQGKSPIDLARYRVDHSSTLGLDHAGIDKLRAPFVIDGFIRRGDVMLLGAESKSRKSWLAQDAAIAVVRGGYWLTDEDGEGGFLVAQGRGILFDLELGEGEIKYRFARTRKARFTDAEARAVTDGFQHFCLDGCSSTEVLAVIEAVVPEISPGDFVVIDCFYRLVADSMEPKDVAAIFEAVKRWAKQTQAAWCIIDHFRKAGADKARDRFNGSFIKSAAPGCLVAIEVRNDGVLEMQIDARSFFGDPKVWCRWDSAGYRFVRISEKDVTAAKQGAELAAQFGWLVEVWKSRDFSAPVTAKDAAAKWGKTEQAARNRFRKLMEAQLVAITAERPMTVVLAERGLKLLENPTGKAK